MTPLEESSDLFNSDGSGHLDTSFKSFTNSLETEGEENFSYEMVFNNQAILKILGIESAKDLHGLLMKPLFVNREHSHTLSLFATANPRYSDSVLGQAYRYQKKGKDAT